MKLLQIYKAMCLVLLCTICWVQFNLANATTVTTNCMGQNVACENISVVVMNSATAEVAWKTALLPVRNLGKITATKDFLLKGSGGYYKHIVSFMPNAGKMAGKPIQIFLIAFNINALPNDLPKGVQQDLIKIRSEKPNTQSILLMYKQFGGGDTWIKIASIESPKLVQDTFSQIKFSLNPEGTATFNSMTEQGKIVPNVIDLTEQY